MNWVGSLSLHFVNNYLSGLKDFGMCFEALMEKLGFETTLRETQDQLESYDREIEAQEISLYYQVSCVT